jgi:hypothetical protein
LRLPRERTRAAADGGEHPSRGIDPREERGLPAHVTRQVGVVHVVVCGDDIDEVPVRGTADVRARLVDRGAVEPRDELVGSDVLVGQEEVVLFR